MKRVYVAVLLLIVSGAALMAGCVSQAQYKNATMGTSFYNFSNLHYWKDNVVMSASGVDSAWNMTVYVRNDTLNGTPVRYMQVFTVGNGMNITYDVWSNATTYNVIRMHAKGYTGDYFQDRDTSNLQIFTLPDVGLSYYYLPFWPIRNVTATMPGGNTIPLTVYSVSDNKGHSITYWAYEQSPVPLKVETVDPNYKITQTLLEYG